MRGVIGIFTVFLSLVGCTLEVDSQSTSIPRELGPDPTVYFCKQDNCTHHLNELLLSAKQSIDCALFDVEEDLLVQTLNSQHNTISVRVVVDNDNDPGKLSFAKRDDRKELMHNKFCIIDHEKVWTGSFNPTPNGNTKNENNAVLLISDIAAKQYTQEFEELWKEIFGSGNPTTHTSFYHNNYEIETLFCPEDNCQDRVIELIEQANHSIYFMLFSFTSEDIADAILFSSVQDIRGIVDATGAGSPYGQFKRLQEFGIEVKKDTVKGKLHHKVFIIDNSTVITGSYNPTKSGAYRNDENILIIHHHPTAQRLMSEFFRLFNMP